MRFTKAYTVAGAQSPSLQAFWRELVGFGFARASNPIGRNAGKHSIDLRLRHGAAAVGATAAGTSSDNQFKSQQRRSVRVEHRTGDFAYLTDHEPAGELVVSRG
jgi:hypothetical protein